MYIIALVVYTLILLIVSRLVSKKSSTNSDFYSAGRRSPWYLVAFGMIGASVSGISLVSVPGMVLSSSWSYLQICLGFIFGYITIAYLLLPLYYRLGVTSIYEYLGQRMGANSRKTASWMFVVAKLISSATKLYVAIVVLKAFLFETIEVPFWLIVIACVLIIWLYTRRSGIRTIVFTDALQTFVMLLAIIFIGVEVYMKVRGEIGDEYREMLSAQNLCNIFVFSDFHSPHNFVKQFLSGIFIVIVMTGLDQDMMQKNLTCSTLKKSQTSMLSYGVTFVPINFVLLAIGSLTIIYAAYKGIAIPLDKPDTILPYFTKNHLSLFSGLFLFLGIIAASFSSADSALTSITTTISVDLLKNKDSVGQRKLVHALVCGLFALVVIVFGYSQNRSIIDLIYTIVGYAYGPLLGMFAFSLFTKRVVRDNLVVYVALLAPLICVIISYLTKILLNYIFGYELLLLNGLLTFVGLCLISIKR